MSRLIFISHIHEEQELAILFKDALEEEFSGFVDIFVSSDGTSIPAGAHFLKKIEKNLIECSAALFLISPFSVNRNWINFELGSVWIRNQLNELNQGPAIPAVPICHSGMDFSKLPHPINSLNAIQANMPSQIEFAFRSIQAAVGGRGKLKTDFFDLASKISRFEGRYTKGEKIKKFVYTFTNNPSEIYQLIDNNPSALRVVLSIGEVEKENIDKLKGNLNGIEEYITVISPPLALRVDSYGARHSANVDIQFDSAIMREYRHLILGK
ncbi:TIR domain-containing protein [Paenibacillus algorifonticola]|uniref:TIR domain-containing protein n=1 Tax=Paenibacillus algorifonticola TaxID=684063 RepID=A0A1I2H1J1_9BACL|nr:toll/interleukin-1 receptor domain-containing protein [Paenibacillus algorifonticola]SFF23398.1 TIR domain-containing protein [Paenibacillus algorifonticola]